jgi:hypothetical protein
MAYSVPCGSSCVCVVVWGGCPLPQRPTRAIVVVSWLMIECTVDIRCVSTVSLCGAVCFLSSSSSKFTAVL